MELIKKIREMDSYHEINFSFNQRKHETVQCPRCHIYLTMSSFYYHTLSDLCKRLGVKKIKKKYKKKNL